MNIDPRLVILGAVKDHNNIFSRRTIEKMVLGIPQTTFQGNVRKLPPSAHASDHFGELEGTGIKEDQVRRSLVALIESGYLEATERPLWNRDGTYEAVQITQRGRDALAGGVDLPALHDTEGVA
jgi:hypothetical protein